MLTVVVALNRFRIFWSVLHVMSLLYVAVEVPYKLIFSLNEPVSTRVSRNIIVYAASAINEMFSLMHIVMMARYFAFIDTSSEFAEVAVSDHDRIWARYKKSGAWRWDVLAAVPLSLIADVLPMEWYEITAFLRLVWRNIKLALIFY